MNKIIKIMYILFTIFNKIQYYIHLCYSLKSLNKTNIILLYGFKIKK